MAILHRLRERLFGKHPQRLLLAKELVTSVIDLAKNNYPNEFVALVHGVIGKDIIADYLLYQTYKSSRHSATIHQSYDFPMLAGSIGSVHSHPGGNEPSSADLQFFSKSGIVHIIIGMPYNQETIAVYDNLGRRLRFEVI